MSQAARISDRMNEQMIEYEAEIQRLSKDIESRELRRLEILEWLEDQIGTGWDCECGWMMYNNLGPTYHNCGREAPQLHHIAFKLYASHFDYEQAAKEARNG